MSIPTQAVCHPSEFADFAELVESSMIHVAPAWTLTSGHLLRRLDVLRRRIAIRWCGAPGAFAGYDILDVEDPFVGVVGWVTLSARMLESASVTTRPSGEGQPGDLGGLRHAQ